MQQLPMLYLQLRSLQKLRCAALPSDASFLLSLMMIQNAVNWSQCNGQLR